MTADEIAQMKAELEKSLYFTVKDSNGKYITATGADGVYTYNGESTSEFRYVLKNSTFTIAELPTGEYTVTEFSTLSDYTIKSENPVKITVVRNQTAPPRRESVLKRLRQLQAEGKTQKPKPKRKTHDMER